jgi:hypothetical protein
MIFIGMAFAIVSGEFDPARAPKEQVGGNFRTLERDCESGAGSRVISTTPARTREAASLPGEGKWSRELEENWTGGMVRSVASSVS